MKSKRKKSYSPLTTIIIATGLYLLSLGGMTYLIYVDKKSPITEKIVYDCTEDDWICKNYKNKLKKNEDMERYPAKSEPISKFIIYYFANAKEELIKQLQQLKTKSTVGDGTCLIHSFLTSISTNYRRLSYSNKETVGQNYRKTFAKKLNINNNIRDYIDDYEIQNISNFKKYNFLIFHNHPNYINIRFIYVNNDDTNNYPWIMTYNTENDHYSAVMSSENNTYIFYKEDGNIIDNIINFINSSRKLDVPILVCKYDKNYINFNNITYGVFERLYMDNYCYGLKTDNDNAIILYETEPKDWKYKDHNNIGKLLYTEPTKVYFNKLKYNIYTKNDTHYLELI